MFAVLWTCQATAQDVWPSRPVKLVVASSAGGGTDTFARFIAQALTESLKQPFLVDNRPGAGGNIGVGAVAESASDGYTFLVSANAQIAINPALYKNLPYNIERSKLLPNVPTLQEAGFPQVEITNSFSVTAPGALPPALIERMSAEVVRAMKSPALLEKLEAQAMVPVYDTPAAFAVSLKKERDMWAAFIQRNKIVLD